WRALDHRLAVGGRRRYRQEPVAVAVREEDVAERRGDDGAEPVLRERPDGMLARGPAAKVRTGHEDRRAPCLGTIELEIRIGAPVIEEARAESGALDALEELLRDDLIGVHIAARQRDGLSPVAYEGSHGVTIRAHPRGAPRSRPRRPSRDSSGA